MNKREGTLKRAGQEGRAREAGKRGAQDGRADATASYVYVPSLRPVRANLTRGHIETYFT